MLSSFKIHLTTPFKVVTTTMSIKRQMYSALTDYYVFTSKTKFPYIEYLPIEYVFCQR